MNKIEFLRQQGGVPKTLPGQDHYTGLIVYTDKLPTPEAGVTGFTADNRIIGISTIEMAEGLGIKSDDPDWDIKALHYHLSEAFRINPAIMLWVGLFAPETDFKAIKTIQNFAEGNIRQVGVYAPSKELSAEDLTKLQGVATLLESQDTPVSICYVAKVSNLTALVDMSGANKKNVSVIIAQAGSGDAKILFEDSDNTTAKKTVGVIGNLLGTLSKSAVHESIGWVQKFPSGIDVPAFCDGTLVKELDKSVIEGLDNKRFIFLTTYAGLTGSFYQDSCTMDSAQSDYANIENVRTMDKAVRGIRTNLLPNLSSPLYVDPETGKLKQETVAFLENVAGRHLEDMGKAGELSGYIVEVDPNQNVLASSTVEFVIKQVGVGVMRKIRVKIGFTTKL